MSRSHCASLGTQNKPTVSMDATCEHSITLQASKLSHFPANSRISLLSTCTMAFGSAGQVSLGRRTKSGFLNVSLTTGSVKKGLGSKEGVNFHFMQDATNKCCRARARTRRKRCFFLRRGDNFSSGIQRPQHGGGQNHRSDLAAGPASARIGTKLRLRKATNGPWCAPTCSAALTNSLH